MSPIDDHPSVLIICDAPHRTLDEITQPLHATAQWQCMNAQAAIAYLKQVEQLPAAIILVQDRPGETSAAAVAHMQNLAPLSGFHVVTGSWCEGETRTGRPWPGVSRCRAIDWPRRWSEFLNRRQQGLVPLANLPSTYSEEERLLAAFQDGTTPRSTLTANGCIAILCDVAETRSALVDALQTAGYTVVACRINTQLHVQPLLAIVCDMPATAANPHQLSAIKSRHPQVPLILITTFPRPQDQALCHGIATTILPKPFLLSDLLSELQQTPHSPAPHSSAEPTQLPTQ